MLWIVIVVLLLFWLIGFPVLHLGRLIHLLLLIALITLLYELLVNRRRVP